MSNDIKKHLINLENGFWKAAGDQNGEAFYQEHVEDEAVFILPFEGGILNKQAVLPTIKQSAPWKTFNFINPQMLTLNDDVQVLYYEVSASHGDDHFQIYVNSTYSNRSGAWKMLLHQQTLI